MRSFSLGVLVAFAVLMVLTKTSCTADGNQLAPPPGPSRAELEKQRSPLAPREESGLPPGPSRAQLQKQAQRCRQILKSRIIDFYLPACVDRVNGGFLESLVGDKFAPTGEKFLTLQARQLWFFSKLVASGIHKEAARAAAKTGFDFLEAKFRDR